MTRHRTTTMSGRFRIEWRDAGREPRVAPNPAYPDGIDLVLVLDATAPTCRVGLPYPAKRIGSYVVECLVCGIRLAASTAGRPDDPRSITMNCRLGAKQ